MTELADGLIFYIVFLLSTTLHEAAHAWAALKGGDSTAYEGGQVTLDPIPHIRREPIGMVVLPLISVVITGWPLGYASAPYSIAWARKFPDRAAWMALAGPAANLALVLLAAGVIRMGLMADIFFAPDSISFADVTAATAGPQSWWNAAAYVVGSFFALNLLLLVFNLLPVPPLDGSAAITLLMPSKVVPRYQEILWGNPGLSIIGIIIAWNVFNSFFDPILTMAINLLYPGMHYSK